MISHDAFGLDKDLVDHGVTVTTVHLVDAVLVEFGQRQQHAQGQSLGLLTVAQLHRLSSRNTEEEIDIWHQLLSERHSAYFHRMDIYLNH